MIDGDDKNLQHLVKYQGSMFSELVITFSIVYNMYLDKKVVFRHPRRTLGNVISPTHGLALSTEAARVMTTDAELLEQASRSESHVPPTRYRLVDLDAACVAVSSTHL